MSGFWDLLFPGGEGAIADLFWKPSSASRPSYNSSYTSLPTRDGVYTYWGGSGKDDVNTFDLHEQYPTYSGYAIQGEQGDDWLSASIINDLRHDQLYGGDGDDFLSGYASLTDYASVLVTGGTGRDEFYASGSEISEDPQFTREQNLFTVFTYLNKNDQSPLKVWVADDVEYISFKTSSDKSVYYLTEDIAKGIIRRVDFNEVYNRAYNDKADWVFKDLDTFTDYHGQSIYTAFPPPTTMAAIVDQSLIDTSYRIIDPDQSAEQVRYYIHPGGDTADVDYDSEGNPSPINTLPVPHIEDYIHDLLDSLDKEIDLDFVASEIPEDTVIDIYGIATNGGGGVFNVDDAWIEIVFEVTGDPVTDKRTVLRDLGSALGLSYPFGNPSDPRYTTNDTVMSTNSPSGEQDLFFTETDLALLQFIWGEEDDPEPAQAMDSTGDGVVDEMDGLLMMRHMVGTFPGDSLTQGISVTSDVTAIRDSILKMISPPASLGDEFSRLDIDGDGTVDPFSDGILILQHIHTKGKQGSFGEMPPMPDFIKNPTRDMGEMQGYLTDLIGF